MINKQRRPESIQRNVFMERWKPTVPVVCSALFLSWLISAVAFAETDSTAGGDNGAAANDETSLTGEISKSKEKPKGSATKKIQTAELLFFNGNPDAAIKAFEDALDIDPNQWEAHLSLIHLYAQKPDYPKAIFECHEVLKKKPKHKDVHLILGNLLRAEGKYDQAFEHLDKALSFGADSALANNARGFGLLQQGKFEEAEKAIRAALDKKKVFPDAHLSLAITLFRRDKVEECLKELDTAIEQKEGKYPEARNLKGDILASKNEYDKALDEYRKAIKDDPKFAQAYSGAGNVYIKKEDFAKAQFAFRKAQQLKPADKDIRYGLAVAFEKDKQYAKAAAEFQRAILLETDRELAAQIRVHISELVERNKPGFDVSLTEPDQQLEILKRATTTDPMRETMADLIKIKAPPAQRR